MNSVTCRFIKILLIFNNIWPPASQRWTVYIFFYILCNQHNTCSSSAKSLSPLLHTLSLYLSHSLVLLSLSTIILLLLLSALRVPQELRSAGPCGPLPGSRCSWGERVGWVSEGPWTQQHSASSHWSICDHSDTQKDDSASAACVSTHTLSLNKKSAPRYLHSEICSRDLH